MTDGSVASLLQETTIQLAALKKSEERFAQQLAPNFEMFDSFRFEEVTLSRCIGNLLNPNGTHGQGTLFLDAFIKLLELKEQINQTPKARVYVERILADNRRIDLLLEIDDCIIGIENKPWAGYQKNQLIDYSNELERHPAGQTWTLVCLANSDPPEIAINFEERARLEENQQFKRLDFKQIEDWLSETAPHARALSVRVFVEELSKFIRRRLNGALDVDETNEIASLLKEEANLQSAVAITAAWPDIRKRMLKDLESQLEQLWSENQPNQPGGKLLWWDESMQKESAECWFSLRHDNEQVFAPSFAFERSGLNGLYWGISTIKGRILDEHQVGSSRIAEIMNQEFGFEGKTNQWWAWWTYAEREPLGEEFRDWQCSAQPWVEIQNGQLAKRIVEIANRAYEALSEQMGLLNGSKK